MRLGTCLNEAQYKSTMARPMRSRVRVSGRFSSREMVDCEHSSPSEGARRHFEHRIGGVVAVLVAGGDHQEAEADDVGESVRDLIWRTLVLDTACETIGDAQPLLDLAQHQDSAVR